MEKGSPGERAFADAFKAWGLLNAQPAKPGLPTPATHDPAAPSQVPPQKPFRNPVLTFPD